MKKLLPTIATLLIMRAAFSQAAYTVSQIPYAPLPFDSGIDVVNAIADHFSPQIGIGFDFYFFGVPYQSLILSTNGFISFDTVNANGYSTWPIDSAIPNHGIAPDTRNSIMFPWQDDDDTYAGSIKHQVYGSPPNRRFVMSFKDVPLYGTDNSVSQGSCQGALIFTGQVILYEGSNIIDMVIEQKDVCPGWNGGYAIEGVQNEAADEAYVVPGRNFPNNWTANFDAWRFTPSQTSPVNLNRISGRVFDDLNRDCQYDSSDLPVRNMPVIFSNPNGWQGYVYTDMQGYYSKMVDTGTYTFTTNNIAHQLYHTTCPPSQEYAVMFPAYPDSSDNNLFADTTEICSLILPDVTFRGIDNNPWVIYGCDTGLVTIHATNLGSVDDSAIIVLTLNDSTQILYSPVPYQVLGNNQYQFLTGMLQPGDVYSEPIMVKVRCDTLGALYCFSEVVTDSFPIHCFHTFADSAQTCVQLGVPFDPNAMYVSSRINRAAPTEHLFTDSADNFDYMVNFQNTGTAVAHNVKVKVPLSAKIDVNTVFISAASASYSWLILNDTLIVDFTGINLPDSAGDENGSQGYFKFLANQVPGNQQGDVILHHANIYFDYNLPVVTNNAIVEIAGGNTTGIKSAGDLAVLLYPNPNWGQITISVEENCMMKVLDVSGRLLLEKELIAGTQIITTNRWANGLYLVTFSSTKGTRTFKIMKQ